MKNLELTAFELVLVRQALIRELESQPKNSATSVGLEQLLTKLIHLESTLKGIAR